MKSKVSRRKELIKMREEINKTETKIRKNNETKSWFLKKKQIDEPLSRFTKKRTTKQNKK